jgi:hypothetical protein
MFTLQRAVHSTKLIWIVSVVCLGALGTGSAAPTATTSRNTDVVCEGKSERGAPVDEDAPLTQATASVEAA